MVSWNHESLGGNNEESDEKNGAEHGQLLLFGKCEKWLCVFTCVVVRRAATKVTDDVPSGFPIFQCQLPGVSSNQPTRTGNRYYTNVCVT